MRRSFLKKRNWPTLSFPRRPLTFVLLSLISLAGLIGLLIFLPPTFSLNLGIFQLSIVMLFFALVGITVFCLGTLITNRKKHGMLAGVFVMIYLWLRLNGLFHPLFLILLIALFLTLELLFTAKKEN